MPRVPDEFPVEKVRSKERAAVTTMDSCASQLPDER
jgi:hypothetical protein